MIWSERFMYGPEEDRSAIEEIKKLDPESPIYWDAKEYVYDSGTDRVTVRDRRDVDGSDYAAVDVSVFRPAQAIDALVSSRADTVLGAKDRGLEILARLRDALAPMSDEDSE